MSKPIDDFDAIKGDNVPYEAFRVRPYELLARFEGD